MTLPLIAAIGKIVSQKPPSKIITPVAMFYDPRTTPTVLSNDIKNTLATDGVWLAQLMTAQPMLDSNDPGNVIHEHIEYYSYKVPAQWRDMDLKYKAREMISMAVEIINCL